MQSLVEERASDLGLQTSPLRFYSFFRRPRTRGRHAAFGIGFLRGFH